MTMIRMKGGGATCSEKDGDHSPSFYMILYRYYNDLMKQFFAHIKRSINDPEYYRDILDRPFSYSFKYYVSFVSFLAVMMTIILSTPLIPEVNRVLREFPPQFFAYYPDELELRVEQGKVSSNVAEPYYLPLPVRFQEIVDQGNTPSIAHMAVIDTTEPITLEGLRSRNALIWVGGNSIAFLESNNGMSVSALPADLNVHITESKIRGVFDRVAPYLHLVGPFLVVMIFLMLMLGFVVTLVYLVFIGAPLIMLVGRMVSKPFSYGEAYRIGLHAVTLPLLLQQLLRLLSGGIPIDLPFLFTALLLLVVWGNFRSNTPSPAPAPRVQGDESDQSSRRG